MNYKKTKILLITILSVTAMGSRAQSLITVKQDGTGNFTTIQEGIDFAANKDTVLVWPGTYVENVIISGKSIVLGSLTLTTLDPVYTGQSIIDGNQAGSCIKIDNHNDTTTLCGFTIKNGSGTYTGTNIGGGIYVNETKVCLKQCVIKNNMVNGMGGGITIRQSIAFLSGLTIKNNTAYEGGGGIVVSEGNIFFDSIHLCNIYLNYAPSGTDFKKAYNVPDIHLRLDTFTVANPDYYYIYSSHSGQLFGGITWDINAGKIDQTSQDLYVAPSGDNNNSGLSPQSPLKDIWYALVKMKSDSVSPDTIHVAAGTYKNSTGEKFPLSLKPYASIKGASKDSCILDAEDEIHQFQGILESNDFQISDFTLINGNGNKHLFGGGSAFRIDLSPNASLKNIIVKNSYDKHYHLGIGASHNFLISNCDILNNTGGRGLTIYHGQPLTDTIVVKVMNTIFENNIPDYTIPAIEGYSGGGAVVSGPGPYSSPDIFNVSFYNCLFSNNKTRPHPEGTGHGDAALNIHYGARCNLINCTLGDNAYSGLLGGNISVTNSAELNIYNSILYNNSPAELYMYATGNENYLNIYHSLVEGGEEGIRLYTPDNNLYYDPSNIDTDPMWDTTSMYPYSLAAGSPCINAGTLNLPQGIELPEADLAGNPRVYNGYVDMGA
ncbi:MAG: DUF1565 domain-containing protein, partial [Bacteroidales bacterium]|nr:DUF1565 domain-containing protein [Bacteroidales bacterium]